MKRLTTLLLTFATMAGIAAEPWRLNLESKDEEAQLRIDLYEESVPVPGMELFGPMNGYLAGKGIYGVWMVTSFKIANDHEATLRLSNDQGSETQAIQLTQQNDSTYLMELQGGVVVKRVVNKKLVKIPARILLSLKP
ncbi:MAG: hypothetical protein IJ197_05425 [Bacteroidaceae bacterium]|nr:hypothetical protein [Bacteroidaceae bacterium]